VIIMGMKEVLDDLMADETKTKKDVLEVFKNILRSAKENYESKLAELDERYRKQAATTTTNTSNTRASRIAELGRNVFEMGIEIFVVKSWKGDPCKYCEALLGNEDAETAFRYITETFPIELGIKKDVYTWEVIPCDWNYMEATPKDNPYYNDVITEEGLNFLWMSSLEISGFPSIRLTAKDRRNIRYEQIIDGLGRHTSGGWSFGVKDILLAFLEQMDSKTNEGPFKQNRSLKDTIEQNAHRSQDDGKLKQTTH
jgi:hypothetical protein